MNKQEAIRLVIEIAEKEVGYLEKQSEKNLDVFTANAGNANITKYWKDIFPNYQGQPWCAVFVSWCFWKAFGLKNAKQLLKHWPYVYCPTLGSLFQKYSYPQAGDIVIFFRNGTFAHTGIVTKVRGDRFETIEGNTSGASGIIANGGGVCRKAYNNSTLQGTKFCRPDYSILQKNTNKSSNVEKKSGRELNKESVRKGIVTASTLNVRKWAGTEYEKINSMPVLKKGTEVDICDDVKAESGEIWHYIRISRKIYGFVCGKYIQTLN